MSDRTTTSDIVDENIKDSREEEEEEIDADVPPPIPEDSPDRRTSSDEDKKNDTTENVKEHYRLPTENWTRNHESSPKTRFENMTFEEKLRIPQLTPKERAAFGGHAEMTATRRPAFLSKKKLQRIRNKLRAHAYVGTRGLDIHKEFERADTDHDGHLSYEEFSHAVRKLVTLSDGDMICLFHLFDKSDDGYINYSDFAAFVDDRPHIRDEIEERIKTIRRSEKKSTFFERSRKKKKSKKRYQQPTKTWERRQSVDDINCTPQQRDAFRSTLRDSELSGEQRFAFTSHKKSSDASRAGAKMTRRARLNARTLTFSAPPKQTRRTVMRNNVVTPGFMRPTANWTRDHAVGVRDKSFAKSTQNFLCTFRTPKLSERQKLAFGAHAAFSAVRTPSRLSRKKLHQIKNKLRAHAYVSTEGYDIHEEFRRFEKECRGHEMSGQLSYEEFAHAIRRLVPLSDGDILCLLRKFDKSGSGFVDYAEFARFVGMEPAQRTDVRIRSEMVDDMKRTMQNYHASKTFVSPQAHKKGNASLIRLESIFVRMTNTAESDDSCVTFNIDANTASCDVASSDQNEDTSTFSARFSSHCTMFAPYTSQAKIYSEISPRIMRTMRDDRDNSPKCTAVFSFGHDVRFSLFGPQISDAASTEDVGAQLGLIPRAVHQIMARPDFADDDFLTISAVALKDGKMVDMLESLKTSVGIDASSPTRDDAITSWEVDSTEEFLALIEHTEKQHDTQYDLSVLTVTSSDRRRRSVFCHLEKCDETMIRFLKRGRSSSDGSSSDQDIREFVLSCCLWPKSLDNAGEEGDDTSVSTVAFVSIDTDLGAAERSMAYLCAAKYLDEAESDSSDDLLSRLGPDGVWDRPSPPSQDDTRSSVANDKSTSSFEETSSPTMTLQERLERERDLRKRAERKLTELKSREDKLASLATQLLRVLGRQVSSSSTTAESPPGLASTREVSRLEKVNAELKEQIRTKEEQIIELLHIIGSEEDYEAGGSDEEKAGESSAARTGHFHQE